MSRIARFVRLLPLLAAFSCLPAHAATYAFNGGAIPNCSYAAASQTYTCSALPLDAWNDQMSIGSGYTVKVSGNVKITYNQGLAMSGSARLESTGSLDIGDINPANLSITGGSLAAGTLFKMGDQAQTVTADISAASMDLGGGSAIKINGNLTSTGNIKIPSHAVINGAVTSVNGNIDTTSPVTINGNISATNGYVDIPSGGVVTGNVTAKDVTLEPSPSKVIGNVVASNNLIIGSGSGVQGNVTAKYAEMQPSDAYITGVANVTSIKMGWHATVQQYIACQSSSCNCLDNGSGYPTNSTAQTQCQGSTPPAGLARFKLTHDGSGLTCSPETVTVRACADAACSSTYTGAVTVTLAPGGTPLALSSGVGQATIRQSTPGVSTISVQSSSLAPSQAAPLCERTSVNDASCAMQWSTSGLLLTVNNGQAGPGIPVSIEAKQTDPSSPASCISAIADGPATIAFGCKYDDPATGEKNPVISGTEIACSPGLTGKDVILNFQNGKATTTLTYADAGRLQLKASSTLSSLPSDIKTFSVAPFAFDFRTESANAALPDPFTKVNVVGKATVVAVTQTGTVTKNFGNESTPSKGTLSAPPAHTLVVAGNYNMNPTLVFKDGVASFQASWDQVGGRTLTATMLNDAVYPGTPFKVAGTKLARFVPARFVVTGADSGLAVPVFLPMTCSARLSAATGCSNYAFSGQPFELQVVAFDQTTNVMQNYGPGFALTELALTAHPGRGAAALSAAGTQAATNVTGVAFQNGRAFLTHTFNLTLPPLPQPQRVAPAPVFFRATSADASSLAATTPEISSTDAAFAIVWGSAGTGNRYGAQNAVLPLTVTARYWDGASYVQSDLSMKPNPNQVIPASMAPAANPLVSPYGAPRADRVSNRPANCTANLANPPGGNACIAGLTVMPDFLTFQGGTATLRLAAPNARGSAEVTSIPFDFLNHEPQPGRVTYGIQKSSPVIYLREVY